MNELHLDDLCGGPDGVRDLDDVARLASGAPILCGLITDETLAAIDANRIPPRPYDELPYLDQLPVGARVAALTVARRATRAHVPRSAPFTAPAADAVTAADIIGLSRRTADRLLVSRTAGAEPVCESFWRVRPNLVLVDLGLPGSPARLRGMHRLYLVNTPFAIDLLAAGHGLDPEADPSSAAPDDDAVRTSAEHVVVTDAYTSDGETWRLHSTLRTFIHAAGAFIDGGDGTNLTPSSGHDAYDRITRLLHGSAMGGGPRTRTDDQWR